MMNIMATKLQESLQHLKRKLESVANEFIKKNSQAPRYFDIAIVLYYIYYIIL